VEIVVSGIPPAEAAGGTGLRQHALPATKKNEPPAAGKLRTAVTFLPFMIPSSAC